MEESLYKSELRKIKLGQRQLGTKLKVFMSQDVSLLDSASFDDQLKSMDNVCYEVTNKMDELIMDLEETDDEDARISDIEELKEKVLKTLLNSKEELKITRNKISSTASIVEIVPDGKETSGNMEVNEPDMGSLELETKLESSSANVGVAVAKKAVKEIIYTEEEASLHGQTLWEHVSDEPSDIVLEIMLGSIGEQLGVKGTAGFFAAALTHYAICQFAVVIGIISTPVKMDFSGITQAKILKKLDDLNNKVDKLLQGPRVEALKHLKLGLLELQNKKINFKEAKKRFEKVHDLATKALTREDNFNQLAVCTKYLLYAEVMVHSYTEDYTEGNTKYGDCFLPIEKLSKDRKERLVTFLENQIKELKEKMATNPGKKMEDHRDKVDDILKMVYNIISACKDLSNPNTFVTNDVTFGIDKDYAPHGEEDAAVLQVGRDAIAQKFQDLNPKEISKEVLKKIPGYTVYVWREERKLCVRRKLKVFEINTQLVHGSVVWVNLTEKDEQIRCRFGPQRDGPFENTCLPIAGYPKYIQKMDTLFKEVKGARDMECLPKDTYEKMQKIGEVYIADLGIDINEKHNECKKTLLHLVSCLNPGKSSNLTAIECLVDAGADLGSRDSNGCTPLMAALMMNSTLGQGSKRFFKESNPLETNIRHMISLYTGTPALNAKDNKGNNVLHIAAEIKESAFIKDIVKILLEVNVDPTHVNSEGFNPRDAAFYHKNFGVHKILKENLTV